MTERTDINGQGGTGMAEQYVRPSAIRIANLLPAPGQLRAGLVLDDDGGLSRRQVGRAGVPAATGRQRHRGQVPHRGLLGRRGDNRAGGLDRAAHLDGLRTGA